MAPYGSATCDFDVGESHDGSHRLISIKPKTSSALLNRGKLTLELEPGFELGDAQVLAKMLHGWITQINFEPVE
jgi:hypothetical protein